MKIAILTANLGNFDTPVDPVMQFLPVDPGDLISNELSLKTFHRFTDENFPPIAGLTPRLQYRIPKLFGWEMFPGYDIYIWLDGTFSFTRPDCVKWFLEQLGDADAAFFKHPARSSMTEEVEHIEDHLKKGKPYITSRYKNGLHKEQLAEALKDPNFKDNVLYTSTAFIYRNNSRTQEMMRRWWICQSRYFTCDQVALPYAIYRTQKYWPLQVNCIKDNQYKIPYLTEVSKHK